MTPLERGEVRIVPLTVPQHERLAAVSEAAHACASDRRIAYTARLYAELLGVGRNAAAWLLEHAQKDFARELDPPGRDVIADPIATVARRLGDCLSLSGLLLSWLLALGMRGALAAIKRPCDEQDHVAVLIAIDGALVWADPASHLPLGQVTGGISCPLPETVTLW